MEIDKEGKEISEDKWNSEKEWDYDPELDEVWLIFDRDYRNLEKEFRNSFIKEGWRIQKGKESEF